MHRLVSKKRRAPSSENRRRTLQLAFQERAEIITCHNFANLLPQTAEIYLTLHICLIKP